MNAFIITAYSVISGGPGVPDPDIAGRLQRIKTVLHTTFPGWWRRTAANVGNGTVTVQKETSTPAGLILFLICVVIILPLLLFLPFFFFFFSLFPLVESELISSLHPPLIPLLVYFCQSL